MAESNQNTAVDPQTKLNQRVRDKANGIRPHSDLYDSGRKDAVTKSQEAHEKMAETPSTFSSRRVWLFNTAILVCYITMFICLGPICVQYFTFRLIRDKYNVTLNSTQESCGNVSVDGQSEMNEVQREASSILLYATIASGVPAAFTCMFLGSFSDFMGRKLLVVASLTGGLVRITVLCMIVQFDLDIQFYYVGAFLDGLVGSMYSIILAASAIVVDITPDPKDRAVRLAVLEGMLLVAGALAQLGVGYLIKSSGYLVPSYIGAGLVVLALLMAIFLLPETVRHKRLLPRNPIVHIRKTFGFYFTEGTKRRRVLFIVGLGIYIALTLTNFGKQSVETLYVLNAPICWNSLDIGMYGSVRLVVMAAAAVFMLKILKSRLSLEVTGIICAVSSVGGFIVEAFAYNTLLMYMCALFSSMSTIEILCTMISTTVYTLIYNETISTFRGAIFIVMAGLCFINLLLLGVFKFLREPDVKCFVSEVEAPGGEDQDDDPNILNEEEACPLLDSSESH
ncbi:unnamed protein product [Lymnaea stagnalis]|uniref:Proton-coupled folate transporter n=1 Tax=Lymnaea stagnalis TaxID=6523 RepID=A0AAV2HNI6_LYMST